MRPSHRNLLAVILWLAALAAAAAVDRPVAEWVRGRGLDAHAAWTPFHRRVIFVARLPGDFRTTLVIALAAGLLLHKTDWRAAHGRRPSSP